MGDQIMEWRIVEHTSLEEEEEEEDDDYDYEGEVKESKMRWILNKGLWLGKKVTITGIVVSSAPVVLPPLVVISALGFAFSVPFGLAFVGYTCTEKLMNKLLPRSEPPLLLEYGEMYGDEEEYDEELGGKGAGFGGEMVMEDEEKKEMEDSKEGVEMRIQLVMDESGGYEDKDFGRAEEEREINVDEGGKEEGYEEDVGEYLEGENEGPVKEMNLETERGKEAENWESDEKIKRTEGLDLVAREARGKNEGEKDVTLTTGLPERNLVEVYVGDAPKEDNHSLKNSEVVEKPTDSKDEKVDSLVREIQGTKTETGPEVISEEKESIEVTKKPNISKSSKKHHKKKKGNEGKTAAIIEKGEGLSNKQQEDSDVKMVEIKEEVRDEVKVKQDEKHLPVKRETKEGRDEVNQSGVSKKAKKAAETEKASPGRRDARNGKDAEQAANSTKDHKAVSNGKHVAKDTSRQVKSKDKLVAAEDAQRKAADVHGNLPSERKGTTDQKKNVNASGVAHVPGRAGILEAKHTKEFYSEEIIWEKINAMRTIVGYGATPQPLLVDELKALYIFTGVEPPSTFRNTSELAEVNDKLQFLMSIVGIK
ncbi:uncharacterized protein [Nicotiana sylvestris]|uniref:Eukaryotic translation initiation factor 5B-like isoform X1 n=2 Tax=Nicotiana sylvestris TaxID=4096 RepID=A0A1U7YBV2_NICSY|nr:PREDICTED: eukaryotic translation initiation factor 5B-like isoform X1 [Nicotiana sylvestris]XP_009796731.1 PREDICTED: eukaryotic translation initiation factor 5B-like isoform X2 [Nicotiana sylvestris]